MKYIAREPIDLNTGCGGGGALRGFECALCSEYHGLFGLFYEMRVLQTTQYSVFTSIHFTYMPTHCPRLPKNARKQIVKCRLE